MKMRRSRIFISAMTVLLMAGALAITPPAMAAQDPVLLGTTQDFAVLAGSTITNTGPTTISGDISGAPRGDIGLHPGTAITGKESIVLSGGAYHQADAVALQAKNDLVTAYNDAAGRLPVLRIATELGGQVLKPGVYDSASGTFGITGTLTLDAENDPEGVFIFLMESTLVTASNSNVALINGARFCRIFWKVGSSATLGTNSTFVGHILAMASITATTGATIYGQLLARVGAVTLDTNTIVNGFCGIPTVSTPVPGLTQVPIYPPLSPTPVTGVPGITLAPGVTLVPGTTFIPGTTLVPWPTPSATNLPPTGDKTADRSTLGILAAGTGIVLVLAGISLYLFKRRKAKS